MKVLGRGPLLSATPSRCGRGPWPLYFEEPFYDLRHTSPAGEPYRWTLSRCPVVNPFGRRCPLRRGSLLSSSWRFGASHLLCSSLQ